MFSLGTAHKHLLKRRGIMQMKHAVKIPHPFLPWKYTSTQRKSWKTQVLLEKMRVFSRPLGWFNKFVGPPFYIRPRPLIVSILNSPLASANNYVKIYDKLFHPGLFAKVSFSASMVKIINISRPIPSLKGHWTIFWNFIFGWISFIM